jgi:glyoxylate carboligase
MIHFDFKVTEEEAQIIFDGIQKQICDTLESFIDVVIEEDGSEKIKNCKTWTDDHVKFLKQLYKKMKHKAEPDEKK